MLWVVSAWKSFSHGQFCQTNDSADKVFKQKIKKSKKTLDSIYYFLESQKYYQNIYWKKCQKVIKKV